jgi:hypothetical protein
LLLKFEPGLIIFEELAELRAGVEEAVPLLVVKGDGKAAESINADAAFFAHTEFEGSGAARLLLQFGEAGFEFFISRFGHGKVAP